MKKFLNPIIYALREIFVHKRFLWTFLVLSAVIYWLLILIPVKSIPGNDLVFQLSLMTLKQHLLFIVLSILTSLSLTMNFYLWTHKKDAKLTLSIFGQGGVGLLSGAIASIFGAVTCAACVSFIFGLLGVGAVFFLLNYRFHIMVGAIIILVISLYFTSQKVLGVCKICKF